MIKKVLAKALAGTAAAGLVLVPTAATVSPQITNVACDYPDTVATSTDLFLRHSIAPYGTRNVAVALVTSGSGTPQGEVRFTVVGVDSWTRTLEGGTASQALPRRLGAEETYAVYAEFLGQCEFRDSDDTAFYTVTKADVNVNPNVVAPRKAVFSARFEGSEGVDPEAGRARFLVKRDGDVVRSGADEVDGGYASVDLKNLPRGSYRLVVRFGGTDNFQKAHDSVRFSVG